MNELPKFPKNNPSNREEKLIMELIESLRKITYDFIRTHWSDTITTETFVVLRDGAIGYAGSMIADLIQVSFNKNQAPYFAAESMVIFRAYMDQLMDVYK